MSENLRMGRNLSPSKKSKSFLLYDDLKHLLGLILLQLILGKEEHTNAIFSVLSQCDPKALCHSLKEFMGDLRQNTNTVTGLTFCILSGTMLQILNDLQCIFNGFSALHTLNVYTGTDTAVIMLKLRTVQRCIWHGLFHIKHFVDLLPLVKYKKAAKRAMLAPLRLSLKSIYITFFYL